MTGASPRRNTLPLEEKILPNFRTELCGTVSRICEGAGFESYDEHLKGLALKRHRREELKAAMDKPLMKLFMDGFDSMFKQAKTEESWDDLRRVAIRLPPGTKAWRPPGCPKEHMRSKRVKILSEELKEMKMLTMLKMETIGRLIESVKGVLKEEQQVRGWCEDVRSLVKQQESGLFDEIDKMRSQTKTKGL